MTVTVYVSSPKSERRTTASLEAAVAEASVGMGQIAILSPAGIGRAVLGSCVGLVLYEPQQCFAAMAHIVLPNSEGRRGTPGKFADSALQEMIESLRRHGVSPTKLVAKLAGGANMFDSKGPFQIGQQNVDAICNHLAKGRIPLLGSHVGGTRGRRTTFDCRAGKLLVEVLGADPITL